MKVTIASVSIDLSQDEYHSLMAILAWAGGVVEYKPGAPQHETLKVAAYDLHSKMPEVPWE